MKNREKINWFKFVIVLVFTVAVFLTGIYSGSFVTQKKMDIVIDLEQSLRLEVLGLELQYSLLEDEPCQVFNDTVLLTHVSELGKKVEYLEGIYGLSAPETINLKEFYSLLQLRHYLLKRKAIEQCGINQSIILYFYSNKKCDVCKEQGYVLTNVWENNQDFSIYSFDVELENPALLSLRSIFDVEQELPVIVINGQKYTGFIPKNVIEHELSK